MHKDIVASCVAGHRGIAFPRFDCRDQLLPAYEGRGQASLRKPESPRTSICVRAHACRVDQGTREGAYALGGIVSNRMEAI